MSDLIRREDARLIALEYISDSMERHGALEAIRALPAVQSVTAQEAADRIEALTAERDMALAEWDDCVERNRPRSAADTTAMTDLIAEIEFEAVNGEVDRHLAGRIITAMRALTAERDRLALAICGGEDAPGYANAQTVETLEHVAKQNQQSHGATINSLLAAEAERDRLRHAIMFWLAAQEPDVDAAINMMRAALKGETP